MLLLLQHVSKLIFTYHNEMSNHTMLYIYTLGMLCHSMYIKYTGKNIGIIRNVLTLYVFLEYRDYVRT